MFGIITSSSDSIVSVAPLVSHEWWHYRRERLLRLRGGIDSHADDCLPLSRLAPEIEAAAGGVQTDNHRNTEEGKDEEPGMLVGGAHDPGESADETEGGRDDEQVGDIGVQAAHKDHEKREYTHLESGEVLFQTEIHCCHHVPNPRALSRE